jgi:uncharacterized protein (TIGR00369 family)
VNEALIFQEIEPLSGQSLFDLFHEMGGELPKGLLLPPPCFETLGGEFLGFDKETGTLRARFPVLDAYLNPYGTLQGGILTALVDNTIGPLSMLVARPNVTRELTMKYVRPVTTDVKYVFVEGRLVEKRGKRLFFSAIVRNENRQMLAKAQSTHIIIN